MVRVHAWGSSPPGRAEEAAGAATAKYEGCSRAQGEDTRGNNETIGDKNLGNNFSFVERLKMLFLSLSFFLQL